MGTANSAAVSPFQLPDRHRATIPFSSADTNAAHVSNARHLEQKINNLPLDTAFLWLGSSVTTVAVPGTSTATMHLDGKTYASEVFKVDPVTNLITVKRPGWFEFNVSLLADAAIRYVGDLHIENNTSASPYPNPTMDFFTTDTVTFRQAAVLHAPIGVADTVQIKAQTLTGTGANIKIDNLFIRWVRPYYV